MGAASFDSSELERVVNRACMAAVKWRHTQVTTEHLLLYLMESRALTAHLEQHGIAVDKLRTELAEMIVDQPTFHETVQNPKPAAEAKFQEIVQTAMARVQSKRRKTISSLDLFNVLIDPNCQSKASDLVKGCGDPDSMAKLRAAAV